MSNTIYFNQLHTKDPSHQFLLSPHVEPLGSGTYPSFLEKIWNRVLFCIATSLAELNQNFDLSFGVCSQTT
jgi:hypothetical protein